MIQITAAEMAREVEIDPKRFRDALRKEKLPWHEHPYMRRTAARNSREHADMRRVLSKLTLWGAMRGTVIFTPGLDLTESTGEVWDAEQ
jgi:hypothetical protein